MFLDGYLDGRGQDPADCLEHYLRQGYLECYVLGLHMLSSLLNKASDPVQLPHPAFMSCFQRASNRPLVFLIRARGLK